MLEIFIVIGVIFVFVMVHHHFTVDRKPLLSARGKVARYNIRYHRSIVVGYELDILFADKSIKRFDVSKKQYFAAQKYDIVDITAKGRRLASIKIHGTQNVIINKEAISRESDLAQAKPMPLNNKCTKAYDKWMAEEREIAERKRKNAEKNKRKTGRF